MDLQPWFAVAGDVIVRSTAVLLAATVLAMALKGSSASARHQVWLLAVVAVLAMPALTLVLPEWRVLSVAHVVAETPVLVDDDEGALPAGTGGTSSRPLRAAATPTPASMPANALEPPVTTSAPVDSIPLTWRHRVAAVWLLGVVITLLPPLLGAMSLRRLQRRARRVAEDALLESLATRMRLRRPPILLVSAERDMPMTWGVARPRLLLPAGFDAWPADRQNVVILHELAHIARRDCLWQWLGHLACAIYWFHPLAWVAARQMCRERERACDDLVLAAGDASPPDYAEHLLHVASGLQPPALAAHAAIAMARPSQLEGRIVAILDPRIDRRRLTRAGVVVFALLALLVPPLAMLRAQHTAPATPLHVNTVDAADKPVAGVDVYVLHEIYPDKNEDNPHVVRVGATKTDANGAAIVQIPQPADVKSTWNRTSIFARVPGKMIGANIAGELKSPQNILMAPAAPMKGKVTVPGGFAPRDVKVSMLTLMINDGAASWQAIYPGHNKWPELFEFPVADDGTFTVPEAPERGGVYLAGNAKGLGEAQFMSSATGPAAGATLELRIEGVLEGIVTREGDGAPVANVKILAHPDHRSGLFNTHPYTAVTDANGKFRIDGLSESIFTLTMPWATSAAEYVLPPRDNVLVKSGQTTRDLKLQLERGALAVGEVIESPTGKPVKGAHVAGIFPAADANGQAFGSCETDAEGRYVLRVPVGSTKLYLSDFPDGYTYLPSMNGERVVEVVRGDADKQVPALLLSPAKEQEPPGVAILRGRVVDASGKPMKGMAIADSRIEIWSTGEMPVQDDKAAVTGDDGRFEFKAGAGIKHRLLVSGEQWQHDKTNEFTPKKGETFTHPDIVVRERAVVGTIRGVVVDPDGKPIEGVTVGFRSPIRTDARGRFSMQVRGERKPVMIILTKTGYAAHNWNDVPFDAKDARFVLHPSSRPGLHIGEKEPPAPKQAVGKPAPKLDVAQWVHLPGAKPPEIGGGGNGRKTFVLFSWNCSDPAIVQKELKTLEAEAAKVNADAVMILSPQTHEAGVRAMLGDERPNVAIGIDRFAVESEYSVNGVTMIAWGFGRMPQAFVVDEQGVVRHAQRGLANLR